MTAFLRRSPRLIGLGRPTIRLLNNNTAKLTIGNCSVACSYSSCLSHKSFWSNLRRNKELNIVIKPNHIQNYGFIVRPSRKFLRNSVQKPREFVTTMENSNSHRNGFESEYGAKTPFLIGVAGGTASGKSTVCKRIMERLGQDQIDQSQGRVVCISQDAFYRPLSEEESSRASKGLFNFDHPDAFDSNLIERTLLQILDGKICKIPNYDYVTNSRLDTTTTIYPADVVLFEGILMFYQPEVRNLFHLKLFVDSDADTRLARRVMRDTKERGRQLEQVLSQYTKLVKPAFEEFCLPTKKFADVIIPRGAENTVAIDLIVQHIKELLHPSTPFKESPEAKRFRHNSDNFFKRPH